MIGKGLGGLVVLILVVVVAVGVAGAQSPLPTPTGEPGGNGGGGGNGGTVELPEIEFDPTVIMVILGLVEFLKQLGVQGRWSLVSSMGLGVALGGSAWLATQGTPDGFGEWFVAAIVGLAYGLAASGLYDLGKMYSGRSSRFK